VRAFLGFLNRVVNSLNNTLNVRKNFVVPKSYHLKSVSFQSLGPSLVVNSAYRTLPAIYFHDQLGLMRSEIGKVWTNWNLSTEPDPGNLPSAQSRPKTLLGIRRISPQSPCSLFADRGHVASYPPP